MKVEQNGKTYFLGLPRAYIEIMKCEGFSLSMSMLSGLKFRMDWDEDEGPEEEVVRTEEVEKAVKALQPYMTKIRPGYGTTAVFNGEATGEESIDRALDLIVTAGTVLTPTIPVDEITAPLKAVKTLSQTAQDIFKENLSPEDLDEYNGLMALREEIVAMENKLNTMKKQAGDIYRTLGPKVQEAKEIARQEMKDKGHSEQLSMVAAPFNATTDKGIYKDMQEKEVPGVLVLPQKDDEEDED